MNRKILLFLSAVVLLGACSASCGDRFVYVNDHVLDTAQSVYELRSSGNLSVDKAFGYQGEIEKAYILLGEGSDLCECDEEAAADKFDQAEAVLDSVDDSLQHIEIKGE